MSSDANLFFSPDREPGKIVVRRRARPHDAICFEYTDGRLGRCLVASEPDSEKQAEHLIEPARRVAEKFVSEERAIFILATMKGNRAARTNWCLEVYEEGGGFPIFWAMLSWPTIRERILAERATPTGNWFRVRPPVDADKNDLQQLSDLGVVAF
jgi:hypothetical protein